MAGFGIFALGGEFCARSNISILQNYYCSFHCAALAHSRVADGLWVDGWVRVVGICGLKVSFL